MPDNYRRDACNYRWLANINWAPETIAGSLHITISGWQPIVGGPAIIDGGSAIIIGGMAMIVGVLTIIDGRPQVIIGR